MSEPSDAERESSGYLRLPLPVAAIGLFVLLAVLLGLGLFANARLRASSVSVPPTVVPVAAATAPVATTAPFVADVTPTVVATPVPAPTATSPPEPTLAPTAVSTATVGLTPLVLATVGESTPPPAAADGTESPTPLPTVEPTLAAEVGQAYVNFWQVRSQAELTLDPTHAPDVMDDGYLQHFLDVLSQLNQEGRAIKTEVVLDYTVVQVTDDVAFVHDRIEDHSYYVEPDTGNPLTDPTKQMVFIEFKLQNTNGAWKVVDSVTEE